MIIMIWSHAVPSASCAPPRRLAAAGVDTALLEAYRSQIDWLVRQAVELETGERKLSTRMGDKEVDLSPNIAAEYRHKAGNMEAIMQAYDRLHTKEDQGAGRGG